MRIWSQALLFAAALLWTSPAAALGDKVNVLIPDFAVKDGLGERVTRGEPYSRAFQNAFYDRFKSCIMTTTGDDMRTIISFALQQQMLGTEDAIDLMEAFRAMGDRSVFVIGLVNENGGQAHGTAAVFTPRGTRLDLVRATTDIDPQEMAIALVEQFPDYCEPRWGGTLTYEYLRRSKVERGDPGGDEARIKAISQMTVTSTITLFDDGRPTVENTSVQGFMTNTSVLEQDAVCKAGEGDTVMPRGHRESTITNGTYSGGRKDSAGTASAGASTSDDVLSISLQIPPTGLSDLTTMAEFVECGEARTDNTQAHLEDVWDGTALDFDMTYRPGDLWIAGTYRRPPVAMDGFSQEETVSFELRGKPIIVDLMKR